MKTTGYVSIIIGLVILLAAIRGRKLTDLPGDFTDLAVGMATFDTEQVSEVLSRKGERLSSTSGFADIPVTDESATRIGAGSRDSDKTVADLITLGKALRAKGWIVAENKALGDNPRPGTHIANGYHYKFDNSGAIDVNWPDQSKEAALIDRIVPEIRAAGFHVLWRVKGHYNHFHVDISRKDI